MELSSHVKTIEQDIIAIRRDLHQIPELGLSLPKTSAYIQKKLQDWNIPYWTCLEGNAIVAEIQGKKAVKDPGERGADFPEKAKENLQDSRPDQRCIALRADMDALFIKEETGLDFASKNGCMHACGHDGHAAMALGAAKVLKDQEDHFAGMVKIFFQPGEEYPGGALPMIQSGCMLNPSVDAVLALHEGSLFPEVPQGGVGVAYGAMMASMDRFAITVRGKGAHGAQPHLSVDAVALAAEIIGALQKIVSREISPVEPAVLSVCQIHGGSAANILPDEVWLEGTVRACSEEMRQFIIRRLKEVSQSTAQAHRGSVEIHYETMYPPLVTDQKFTAFFAKRGENLLGKEKVAVITKPSMGGEDMAFFLKHAPGTFFSLMNPKISPEGAYYPHHNSRFDIEESYLWIGSALLAQTAFDFLTEEEEKE